MLDFQTSVAELYKVYNEVIKPLIADYEAREQRFPTPIFNEIRAFNDHIAQCYRLSDDRAKLEKEVNLAKRHIFRIVLDCYKYLDVSLYDKIERFEKRTKSVDLTIISNGLFYPNYRRINQEAVSLVRQARTIESMDREKSLEIYQEAFNKYTELEDLIEKVSQDVKWARRKISLKKIIKVILWLIAAIISGLVSVAVSGDYLKSLFK